MERRRFISSIGGIGTGLLITGNVSASNDNNLNADLNTEFDPNNKEEVNQFVIELFTLAKQLEDDDRRRLDELVSELNNEQLGHISQFLSNEAEMSFEEKTVYRDANGDRIGPNSVPTELRDTNSSLELTENSSTRPYETTDNELTTHSLTRRGSTEHTIEATIGVPMCNQYLGCYTYNLDAFEYTQELQWFYNGETVENASATTNHSTSYYAIVGWNFKGNSDTNISYHSNNLYVESYTEGEFDRIAFSDRVPTGSDYASMTLVGHNNGHGHVGDERVYG